MLLRHAVSAALAISVGALAPSAELRARHRSECLNLLNHPLNIQLATGALPYGSFLRLLHDRETILGGLRDAIAAAGADGAAIDAQAAAAEADASRWTADAEASGKSIFADVQCYTCGGNHLNIDCPEDLAVSGAARALAAILRSAASPAAAAASVEACAGSYGWACETLLRANLGPSPYDGWLRAHADAFSAAGAAAAAVFDAAPDADDAAYVAAQSALYNYLDQEASTAGLKGSGEALDAARRKLDALEPGFLDAQDRNSNFVRDTLKAQAGREAAAEGKMGAATAYLAAKNAKAGREAAADAKMSAAAAYLAAKKAKTGDG